MKTYLQNTAKLYLVNQKSSRTYGVLHKTMGAAITANEKQLVPQKIDGSSAVSKYVGETEKRLNKVFLKAQLNNLMLLIAGADVLMGRR